MVAVRCGIHVLWVVWKDQEWLGFDGVEKKIIVPVEDMCVLVMNRLFSSSHKKVLLLSRAVYFLTDLYYINVT